MRRKSNRNTKVIVLFIVLLAVAHAIYQTGMPFAESQSVGASSTASLQDELLYKWDDAKRLNYNAQFQMVMEAKSIDNIADSLHFLTEYVEKYKGSILSKHEYLVRVPVPKTKDFNNKVKSLASIVKYSSDYSTSLNAGSLESYNDSLITLQAKRKNLEQLRRDNPNIKGYTDDIQDADKQINRINSMKQSLHNQDYDLYLIAFSEQYNKGINSAQYIKNFSKPFLIALVVLSLAIPLIALGSKLLFKVLGIVGASTNQLYGAYYNKSYKSGGSDGYGYGNYGRKRHVKRIYKDKPSGSEEKSTKDS